MTIHILKTILLEINIKEQIKKEPGILINTYQGLERYFCNILSIFYGKHFYSFGLIESRGDSYIPIVTKTNNRFYKYMIFNSEPRNDANNNLDFSDLKLIDNLLSQKSFLTEKMKLFIAASDFYNQALENINKYPTKAYLDLITAGEILTSDYNYEDERLYEKQILNLFKEISSLLPDGEKKLKSIKKQLLQIKKKFTLMILDFIDNNFFKASKAYPNVKLTKDNLEDYIKKAYDLRSLYIHSGEDFGALVLPLAHDENREIQNYNSPGISKKLTKILNQSPTFIGLERVIHYCLYKKTI